MIAFAHRRAFWFGIAAVSAGVVLHLPMYVGARGMGYQLAGMPMDPSMKAGMGLIVVGIALSGYGLVARGAGPVRIGSPGCGWPRWTMPRSGAPTWRSSPSWPSP
jgi:hypothetical protein